MNRFFLDTNIFIYFMQDVPEVESFFDDRITSESIVYYSFITRLELLGLPQIIDEVTEKIDLFLDEFYRIDYNLNIEEYVVKIRKDHKIKIPDSIIAASAIYTNSTLITRNVKDFRKIEGLELLNPFDN